MPGFWLIAFDLTCLACEQDVIYMFYISACIYFGYESIISSYHFMCGRELESDHSDPENEVASSTSEEYPTFETIYENVYLGNK